MFLWSKVRRMLTTLPPSVADCLYNVGALTSHNPIGLHGLLRGQIHFMEKDCASSEVRYCTVSTATSSQYLAVNCQPIV
jgi:hypothetical protein